MLLSEYEELLGSEGYALGVPPLERWAQDAQACQDLRCSGCGHLGMRYYPFICAHHYRPLAACPRCGEAFEL